MKCPFCNSILENGYCKSCERQIHELYRHPNVNMHDSCLTGIISFGLIFFVFLQMGFLAALGFAFFTFIGKIISLIISVKSLLKGKIISPIMLDVAIWIISYCLVTWLA